MFRLLSICAQNENPAGQFFWGNLESLNHENLSEIMVDFWKRHYSASRMTLAVQSKQPMHDMVEWIDNLFSEVPTDHQPPPVFKISGEPFCPDRFHKIFKIVSARSNKKIIFSWYLPPVIKLYKMKPLEYIAWIVGHEGNGTLISYLRKLKYAMALQAGEEDDFYSNSIYSLFSITIELTDLGLKNVNEVIELTFSFLNLVKEKGISENIFKQIQTLALNDFNFAENNTAVDHVMDISGNMLLYDEEDYLSGPFLFHEYSPKTIAQYLNLMTANRVAIFILATKFNNSLFTTDPIFKTKYFTEDITKEVENKWTTVKPHSFFKIDVENPFLTTDFTILPNDAEKKYPEKIFENNHIELWYKQDKNFKLPKSYIMFHFITQQASKSTTNYMCLDLFLDSLVFLLNEDTYPATIAQLNYSTRMLMNGYELTFIGFNEKLTLLIDIVLNCIKNFEGLITEEIFEIVRSKTIDRLKNNLYDLDIVSTDTKNSLILDPYCDLNEQLLGATNMSFKNFLKLYQKFKCFYCRTLIQGNVNQTKAIDISNKVLNILNYRPLSKESFPVQLIKRLNQGEGRVKLHNNNPIDNNSMAYKYYQFDNDKIQQAVKYQVLQSILEESAFDELRTKQCLGYDVQLDVSSVLQHYGFYFKVAHQEKKFETKYVYSRMDKFLKRFWRKFNDFDEIMKVRDSLIAIKSTPDDSLEQEFNRYKNEIIEERFIFNRLELEVEALKEIKFKDVKNLKNGFLQGRCLSVEIIGNSKIIDLSKDEIINLTEDKIEEENEDESEDENEDKIEDEHKEKNEIEEEIKDNDKIKEDRDKSGIRDEKDEDENKDEDEDVTDDEYETVDETDDENDDETDDEDKCKNKKMKFCKNIRHENIENVKFCYIKHLKEYKNTLKPY